MTITFQGEQVMPQYGTPEYAALQTAQAGGVDGAGSYDPLKKEVSVVSTNQGKRILDKYTAEHNADMTNMTPPAPVTPETPKAPPNSVNESLKSQGGISMDEVNTTGVDVSNYTYDSKSKYWMPTKTNPEVDTVNKSYDNAEKTVNDAFSGMSQNMDTATWQLVQSLRSIFADRITDAKQANENDKRNANTVDMRLGFNRYAPMHANAILSNVETLGLERLRKISMEESTLLAQANQSLQDKKYTSFIAQRNELNDLRKERTTAISKIMDEAKKRKDEDAKARKDAEKDQQIVGLITKGITDPAEILKNLKGTSITGKDIENVMKSLNPNGDITKASADVRDFFILKANGGKALPASITSLPEEQQLMAYLKMKGDAVRKATAPRADPTEVNKVTPAEANKYGFPPEMIGMSEKEALVSLQNEEPPQWFLDIMVAKAGGNKGVTASPVMMSSLWDQFRTEVAANINPEEKTKEDTHAKASTYFSGTYGDALTEEQITMLADRVELYTKGGMSYKDAVAKVVTEASQ